MRLFKEVKYGLLLRNEQEKEGKEDQEKKEKISLSGGYTQNIRPPVFIK